MTGRARQLQYGFSAKTRVIHNSSSILTGDLTFRVLHLARTHHHRKSMLHVAILFSALHAPARHVAPACRAGVIHAAAAPPPPPPLNATDFAGLLEASFVPAVMSLSRGDVTETKLFVAAANAAYTQKHPMQNLMAELAACPVQSAGRPLMPEEEALRQLWLGLVFLASEQLRDGSGAPSTVPEEFRVANADLVANLLAAKAAGTPLSEVTLEDVLKDAPAPGTMEAAVMTQSLRIVYLTDDVLEDVALAGTRADAPQSKDSPGPYIPGATV